VLCALLIAAYRYLYIAAIRDIPHLSTVIYPVLWQIQLSGSLLVSVRVTDSPSTVLSHFWPQGDEAEDEVQQGLSQHHQQAANNNASKAERFKQAAISWLMGDQPRAVGPEDIKEGQSVTGFAKQLLPALYKVLKCLMNTHICCSAHLFVRQHCYCQLPFAVFIGAS